MLRQQELAQQLLGMAENDSASFRIAGNPQYSEGNATFWTTVKQDLERRADKMSAEQAAEPRGKALAWLSLRVIQRLYLTYVAATGTKSELSSRLRAKLQPYKCVALPDSHLLQPAFLHECASPCVHCRVSSCRPTKVRMVPNEVAEQEAEALEQLLLDMAAGYSGKPFIPTYKKDPQFWQGLALTAAALQGNAGVAELKKRPASSLHAYFQRHLNNRLPEGRWPKLQALRHVG